MSFLFSQKPSMGIMNLEKGEEHFRLERFLPSIELQLFIKHYWVVEWELAEDKTHIQEVIPNPCVNLVIESGRTYFYGPATRKYSYQLSAKGRVFGIKFKPGGFFPWYRESISKLIDHPLPVDEIFPISSEELESIFLNTASNHMELTSRMNDALLPLLPPADKLTLLTDQMTEYIRLHHEVTRVDQVCEQFAMNKRTLQRMFKQYVGISPKNVIKLYRLQNAAEALDHGQAVNTLELSLALGYHDQSHFIKDFKTIVGQTPDAYTRSVARRL
ncbi:helix-turn-helix transcriptional regulator [Paenibacillus sp. 453mf]|uniref:helix-turn-helix transcriptional regulator n=1 Tax=Paenibacillus sp. 453mf TaxID=1761874 RepID=UPI0008F05774|nr:helix-turn-helix transcriptional regulator [Paenibacillus sp. 453mf]SFS37369.1 AraC-type DNA-binding protein [Paenibacillus sp. 453mf]